MFTTETCVINWIYTFRPSKGQRRLDHLYETLAKLGDPHKKLKTVHIAGTNGKGSTVAYIREAFMRAGYKVATFTSPFITCFGERMSINNMPISEANLIKYANSLKDSLPDSTAEYASFDIITLISFLYFADANVDIAIYETGIGGRLDSTNVITPLAAAITNVGHDHAEILGDTQLKRAIEKLGIVKEGIPLFTTVEDAELLNEFEQVCKGKKVPLFLALEDAELKSLDLDGVEFSCCQYKNIKIKMQGIHQFKNAALAVCMLDYLRLDCGFEEIYPPQILNASWQGRFEYVQKEPPVVLDGAHNLEGIQALTQTLEKVYPTYKKKFLFSAIATKDAKKMIQLLSEVADAITFTKGTHPASIAPEVLAVYYGGIEMAYDDYTEAIDFELDRLKGDEILVICGSLYFISDARKIFI
jgi:dihydrofolate synthase/folylpolyglutamate synthase